MFVINSYNKVVESGDGGATALGGDLVAAPYLLAGAAFHILAPPQAVLVATDPQTWVAESRCAKRCLS